MEGAKLLFQLLKLKNELENTWQEYHRIASEFERENKTNDAMFFYGKACGITEEIKDIEYIINNITK
jgi:hypothetical protein